MTLGQTIQQARIVTKMRQRQLSKKTGISQKYLSEIENDHVDPRVSILQRIARVLPLNTATLFPYEPPPDFSE